MNETKYVEYVPEEQFIAINNRNELIAQGIYCPHCDNIHFDLVLSKLMDGIFWANCPNIQGTLLVEIRSNKLLTDGA